MANKILIPYKYETVIIIAVCLCSYVPMSFDVLSQLLCNLTRYLMQISKTKKLD